MSNWEGLRYDSREDTGVVGEFVKGLMHYSGSLTSERTLRHEMRTALSLMQETSDWTAVRHEIIDKNLFQTRRLRTTTTYLQQIRRRVEVLDDSLRQAYLEGGLSDQNALLLYTFARSYRIVYEFVVEEVHHSWKEFKPTITRADFLTFMARKAEQSAVIAQWSPKTIRNVYQVLTAFLGECQLLGRVDTGRWEITPVPLSPGLKAYVATTERYVDFLTITLNA